MIRLIVRPGEPPRASGLIPGQSIALTVGPRSWIIHRHGPDCHAHELEEEETK